MITMMASGRHEQARAVEKRRRILDAAAALGLQEGAAAVTHRRVAERAGVPGSAIRYYFRTREDLLIACAEDAEGPRDEDTAALIASLADRDRPDDRAAAEMLLRAYYGPDLSDASVTGTVSFAVDCAREGAQLAQRMKELRDRIDEQLAELLGVLGLAGLDPNLVTAVLDGSIVVSTAQHRPDAARLAVDDLVAVIAMSRAAGVAGTGAEEAGAG